MYAVRALNTNDTTRTEANYAFALVRVEYS
jgi:hypothetical protein